MPINASGPVTFGSPVPGPSLHGGIALTNTSNAFTSISLVSLSLVATNPGTLGNADVSLDNAYLNLVGSKVSGTPPRPIVYTNNFNVLSDSTLVTQFITALIFPDLGTINTTIDTVDHVTLGNAKLTTNIPKINTLTLAGNGTLAGASTNGATTIAEISQDGAAPRSLTFATAFNNFTIVLSGNVSTTGTITVSGITEFNGTVTSAAAPLLVLKSAPSITASLAGIGNIHRAVILSNSGRLSPGKSSPQVGTLTLDSLNLADDTTSLLFNLGQPNVVGGPFNDLVNINSDLTLDGNLLLTRGPGFTTGQYTLFTYNGSLTDHGLTLPTIPNFTFTLDLSTPGQVILNATQIPEPTTLLTLALPILLHLTRRHRKQN
jgi:fibronectin-binding autotransporter adhesin